MAGVTTMELHDDVSVEVGNSPKGSNRGGSNSNDSSSGIEKPPEGAVALIFNAIANSDQQDIDIAAHEQNAERELTTEEVEAFDLPEGTNLSVESLFDVTIEREYVGNPKAKEETFDTEEEADEAGGTRKTENSDGTYTVTFNVDDIEGTASVDRHTKVDLAHAINGYHADDIDELFGENVHIRVGVGNSSLSYDDAFERAKFIRFKVTEGSVNDDGIHTSKERKARAKFQCEDVDFSRADLDEWLTDHGNDE